MQRPAQFDESVLRAACPQETFIDLQFGRRVNWRSGWLRPTSKRISRIHGAFEVIGNEMKQLLMFLTIVSIFTGGLVGLTAALTMDLPLPWWQSVPGCIIFAFVGLFITNFYSRVFVDRIHRPQDVLFDFSANELTWKSWRGVHHQPLSDIAKFDVSLIGDPVASDGAALTLHLPGRRLVVLESTLCQDSMDESLNSLIPFAKELAKPLGVPVMHRQLGMEELTIHNRGAVRTRVSWIVILGCISPFLLAYIYHAGNIRQLSASSASFGILATLIWMLPILLLVIRNKPYVTLDRKAHRGTQVRFRKPKEFDLHRARGVTVEEIVTQGKWGPNYDYPAWLVVSTGPGGGDNEIPLEEMSSAARPTLVAMRVAEFLRIPMRAPQGLKTRVTSDFETE